MTRTAVENRLADLLNELADHAHTEPPATTPVRATIQPDSQRYGRLVAAVVFVVAGLVASVLVWSGARDRGADHPTALTLAPGSVETLPDAPISGRSDPASVWTGREFIVWGGYEDGDRVGSDGAAYDPTTRGWRLLPAAPIAARANPGAVWTGTEMIVSGGSDGAGSVLDGAAYNPETNAWRTIPTVPLEQTIRPTAVWTGTEMVVLEGINGAARGAAYSPETNTWRAIANPPGRSAVPYPHAVWTGHVAIVELGSPSTDAPILAQYDPVADTWQTIDGLTIASNLRPSLTWTGDRLLVLAPTPGGLNAAWDPSSGTWETLSPPPISVSAGYGPAWVDGVAVVWSGGPTALIYRPESDAWQSIDAGGLNPREAPVIVSTGSAMIAWGGFVNRADGRAAAAADGVVLRPPNPTTVAEGNTSVGYASSAAWRDRASEILADKAANAARAGYDPLNKGDWAYLSDPIDVTAPGTYDLTVPVDDRFDYPNDPKGFVLLPPPDISFQSSMVDFRLDTTNGERTFHITLIVTPMLDSGFRPYPQVSFWIA